MLSADVFDVRLTWKHILPAADKIWFQLQLCPSNFYLAGFSFLLAERNFENPQQSRRAMKMGLRTYWQKVQC